MVKDFVQIEMTTAARLPSDLECIMEEAVSSGVANEDALEDCVSKIEQYRMLFGAGAPSGHKRDLNGITKFVEKTLRDAKPIEVVPHKDEVKHVMFKEVPSPTHSSKKVLHHEIATYPDKLATRKFEANNDIRELVSKHVKFDEAPTPLPTDHKTVTNHKIASFPGRATTKKFEESKEPKPQAVKETPFQEAKQPRKAAVSDSDSDDFRVPNQLVLKSTSTPSLLQSSFLCIPDLLR